jgi:GNAT superfamily N-acetyltransferase
VLRARYPDPPGDRDLTPDQQLHRHLHHPPVAPPEVLDEFPAHLHVNLLPRAQGRGVGRRLLETLFDALAGVAGIHLGVAPENERAAAFYAHLGFVPIGPPLAPGAGRLLGRPLTARGGDRLEVSD